MSDEYLRGTIGLDTSPFKRALRGLPGAASQASTGVARSFRGAGLALAALGAATLAVTAKAAKMAAAYQKGMAEVKTIFTGTIAQFEEMERKTLQLGRVMGETMGVMTKALYQTVSAGFTDAADATLLLEKASIFAKAALVDTETSVDVLTTVLNSYNMSAEKAGHVSDVLFETIRLGKIRGEELAHSLGRVTSIAASAGISFEELSATIAAATQRGLRGDVAITGLRTAIMSLVKPSEQSTKMAKAMGMEWNLAAVKAKGLAGIMRELKQKTTDVTWAKRELIDATAAHARLLQRETKGEKGLSKAIKESAESMHFLRGIIEGTIDPTAQLVGNARGLAVWLAASNAEAEKGAITNAFKSMTESSGQAQRAAEVMMDTIDHKWAVVAANMEQAMIRFGTSVLPPLQKVLEKINEIFEATDLINKQAKKAGAPELGMLEMTEISLAVEAQRTIRWLQLQYIKNPKTGEMEPQYSEEAKRMFPSDPGRYYTNPSHDPLKWLTGGDPTGRRDMEEEIQKLFRERIGFDDPKQQPGTVADVPLRLDYQKKHPGKPLPTDERLREMDLTRQIKEREAPFDKYGMGQPGDLFGAQRMMETPVRDRQESIERDRKAREHVRRMMLEDAARQQDPIPTAEPSIDIPTGIRRPKRRRGPRGYPQPAPVSEENIGGDITINIEGVIDEKMLDELFKRLDRHNKRKAGLSNKSKAGVK